MQYLYRIMTCSIGGAMSNYDLGPGSCYYMNKTDFPVLQQFDQPTSAKIIKNIRSSDQSQKVLFNNFGSVKIIDQGVETTFPNKLANDNGVFIDTTNPLKDPLSASRYFVTANGLWLIFVDITKNTVSVLYNPMHRTDVASMYDIDSAGTLDKFDEYCKKINYADSSCYCTPVSDAHNTCILDVFNGDATLMDKVKSIDNEGFTKLSSNCPCMNYKCATHFGNLDVNSFMSKIINNPHGYDGCKDKTLAFTVCNSNVSVGGAMSGKGPQIAQNCGADITSTHDTPQNKTPKPNGTPTADGTPKTDGTPTADGTPTKGSHKMVIGIIICCILLLCCLSCIISLFGGSSGSTNDE